MERVWEFFDNLGEYVYACDADTYELVYMNKKMLADTGVASIDEVRGKKCHEVLKHSPLPCAICNMLELVEGEFWEWEFYNPAFDRYLMMKDTLVVLDGRRYRMEIAIDVTISKEQSDSERRYQNLEVLSNRALQLASQEPTLDDSLCTVLEHIGIALDAERTYIFEKNAQGGDDNTYEWAAPGISREKDNLQNLPPDVCANWYAQFANNHYINIDDIEDIKADDPLQYENLKRQNIHSLVVVPLYVNGKAIGFYGVDNPPHMTHNYARNMLEILGHYIVSTIKLRNLVNKLHRMSYSDTLTMIGNRYAMNDYIEGLRDEESVGVVYCDVTGLKRVNDTKGHEAGDKLILAACSCLKEAFDGYGLFRIGGDELLALCARISEEDLWRGVRRLKATLKEKTLTMAIGATWVRKRGDVDMDDLMAEAEKLMYVDKAAYYKATGLKKRRR